MGKKLATTPRGKVRAAVSRIFNYSRERSAAIKRTGNRCESCGAKFRPKATRNGPACRCQVHHLDGGGIDEIVDLIMSRLLCPPERLSPLCVPCHDRMPGHNAEKKKVRHPAPGCGKG